MKFVSFSVVFPSNSIVTSVGDFHSALILLLPDRAKDGLKEPAANDSIDPIPIINDLNVDKKSTRLSFTAPASTVVVGELPLPVYLTFTAICLSDAMFVPVISTPFTILATPKAPFN